MVKGACGLICDSCILYIRKICPGCHPKYLEALGMDCEILTCALSKNLQSCEFCSEFPCNKLERFPFSKTFVNMMRSRMNAVYSAKNEYTRSREALINLFNKMGLDPDIYFKSLDYFLRKKYNKVSRMKKEDLPQFVKKLMEEGVKILFVYVRWKDQYVLEDLIKCIKTYNREFFMIGVEYLLKIIDDFLEGCVFPEDTKWCLFFDHEGNLHLYED